MIREGKYRSAVEELRGVFPILKWTRKENGTVDGIGEVVKNLPRVSLVSELRKREGQTERGAYNGLVLVEVDGLKDYGTACGVRDMVKDLPQTFMAFVGPSGRSVKIVCRVEPLAGKKLEAMDLEIFHANAYRMACQFYEAQLNMSIGYVIPHLDRLCYMSADDGMVYQPEAIPFYTDDRDSDRRPLTGSKGVKEDVSLIPGRDHFQSLRIIYQYCLRDAMGLSLEAPDEDEQVAILNKLAFHCMESGIPMAMAVRYTLYNPTLGNDELLVKTVFENIYLQKQGEDYYRRRGKVCPLKHVPESTLLMMQTDIFLHENYEMRMNVMTGVPQFRELDKYTYDFRDISPEDQNTMTIRALQSGLKSWDKDIARYINSSLIPKYDPVNDYLDHLPQWDGEERVAPLARRVPTNHQDWPQLFHIWMRSMVAQWMGRNPLHGNAIVPLLVGYQGCGKSSFCGIILPPELRDYYNDSINFKNQNDINAALASFALINIDEFDKLTSGEQPLLKFLISKSDVKGRQPYGKAILRRRRYASFIATTNHPQPLTDTTGSRRFICVYVKGGIDFMTPIDYPQLYAQLRDEILHGERYWFDEADNARIMEMNRPFHAVLGMEELLDVVLRKPEEGEEGRWMTVSEIALMLKDRFRHLSVTPKFLVSLGRKLKADGYDFRHRKDGNTYRVVVMDEHKQS